MLNKVTLIGNLGKDPEIRAMGGNDKVANFSLAVSESWKDRNTGERKTATEWVNVAVFSQGLIPVIEQYIHKGSKVYIEGKLKTRKWTDQSGQDKYTTEVVLNAFGSTFIMLDSKKDASSSRIDPQAPQVETAVQPPVDDDVPF